MALRLHDRQVRGARQLLQRVAARSWCWARSLLTLCFQMAHAGQGAGRDRRRQGGGKDETGGIAAHEIDQGRGGRDIAAENAEGLAQGALDHGQAVHQAFTFGDTAAARRRRGRRHGLRPDRSWRHEPRRRRRTRRSARCRRPWSRPIRRQPVWPARARSGPADDSRSSGSLCRKMHFSARLWRMPSIIEAWLPASDRTTQSGRRAAKVPRAAQFET